MNTATTAENPSVEDEVHVKAEIRRMSEEIEQIFADMAESQRRIDALAASTQARLDHLKEAIRTRYPSANPFS